MWKFILSICIVFAMNTTLADGLSTSFQGGSSAPAFGAFTLGSGDKAALAGTLRPTFDDSWSTIIAVDGTLSTTAAGNISSIQADNGSVVWAIIDQTTSGAVSQNASINP